VTVYNVDDDILSMGAGSRSSDAVFSMAFSISALRSAKGHRGSESAFDFVTKVAKFSAVGNALTRANQFPRH